MTRFLRNLLLTHTLGVLTTAVWVMPNGTLQAQSAVRSDTMVLTRKFTGTRFAASGVEGKVAGLVGLTPEFKSVLAKHPEALRAANRTQTYAALQLVGSLGVAVAGALALKQTLDQKDDLLGAEPNSTPLVLMAGSGAVTLVGLFGGRHHLMKAVRLYNEGQRGTVGGGAMALLGSARLGVGVLPGDQSPRATVGVILPLPERLR